MRAKALREAEEEKRRKLKRIEEARLPEAVAADALKKKKEEKEKEAELRKQ